MKFQDFYLILYRKIQKFHDKLNDIPIETDLTSYQKILARIKAKNFESTGNENLQQISSKLMKQAKEGVPLDELLVETYALVREVSKRMIGLSPFDVQVIAGIAMHQGKVVELPTGEGKTLAAVFPACLNALKGCGIQILTFNDYLARRDAAWMGPIYEFLGLTVGCIQEGTNIKERQKAYACDITYVTAKEAGFDFLRDHICYNKKDLVHRPFHFALVDEADSILIDEARVPLVLAGIADKSETPLYQLSKIAGKLMPGKDFNTDQEKRNIYLTDSGLKRVERILSCSNLHDPENIHLLTALNCALHAEILLRRDKDYIIRKDKIEIVDEFTGRVVDKRHWPDGLQAAVEAKENLKMQPEGSIMGSITLQHFFRLYPRLCGMTATAQSAANEFKEFYGLVVVIVPPNRPSIRVDFPDVVFTHKEAKRKALIDEIRFIHAKGRPILVGTSSVEESEQLADNLQNSGIFCQVLNAKNDELEARIVAQAGSLGAVTISTNMAGRGTDIRLGGAQEQEHDRVAALGGLYVIGTNRHESLRIDNQLRGRTGRQGDPGSTRFFISLEDDLIECYDIRKLLLVHLSTQKQDKALTSPLINREISRAQRIIEGQNFEIRKTLWKYSYLIENQQRIIHKRRQDILLLESSPGVLKQKAPRLYKDLHSSLGKSRLQKLERHVSLELLDRCWKDHLAYIADIRESIHLVSIGGMAPVDEFHKMATAAFLETIKKIDSEIVKTFFSIQAQTKSSDLTKEELKGPSSTWTYLISDDQFGWGIELIKGRNIGFSIGAALWIFIWGIYSKVFRKKKKSIKRQN